MPSKYVLLLTACIEPAVFTNFSSKTRLDPTTRLDDYMKALKYWLNCDIQYLSAIVFVENSGYDLVPLKKIAAENNPNNYPVEFLQKKAGAIPPGIHYGYSELEMIDYAFANSTQINQCDYVIKATGRLYFPKLNRLIKKLPDKYKMVIDSRDYELPGVVKHYLVTTIFIVQKDFYNETLCNAKVKMLPFIRSHTEHLYYQLLKPIYLEKKDGLILRLPFSMNPVGYGAHWNVDYGSVKKQLAVGFRDIMRVIAPWFWV